jgi:hypothetical protein
MAQAGQRRHAALEPDDIIIGGGNVLHMKKLPKGCRATDNDHAFIGGFRIWDNPPVRLPRGKRPAKTVALRFRKRAILPLKQY